MDKREVINTLKVVQNDKVTIKTPSSRLIQNKVSR